MGEVRPATLVSTGWLVLCSSGFLGCVPEERPAGPAPSASGSRRALTPARSFRTIPREPSALAPSARPQPSRALLDEVFEDRFDRPELGALYHATAAVWRIEGSRLCGEGALNRPVWLNHRLPRNVRISFDAVSESEAGDIKVEVFGDGRSFASSTAYDDASGYVLIYGGWNNSLHVLARRNEHGKDRLALRTLAEGPARGRPVTAGRRYRFSIERTDGKTLRWLVDGVEIHALNDRKPLWGPRHEHFAFNTWQARVCFDNLKVVPLGS